MAETARFSYLIESSFPEIGSVNLIQLRSLLVALIKHLQLYNTEAEYDGIAKKKGVDDFSSPLKMAESDEYRGEEREFDESGEQTLNTKRTALKRKIDGREREEDRLTKDEEIAKKLEKKITGIEKKLELIETWPNNEELISRSRKPSNTPFSDWWTMSNLSNRMDASEDSLKKFASALEELSRETGRVREWMSSNVATDAQHSESKSSFDERDETLTESLAKTDRKVAKLKKEMSDLTLQQKNILAFTEGFPLEPLPDIIADISHLKSWVNKMETKLQPSDLEEKMKDQMREHTEKLNELNMNLLNQTNTFQGQITDIEKELGTLNERLNIGASASEGRYGEESLGELYNKLQGLQEEIENLNETTTVLISGQKERESNINSLLEQVQLIKHTKADKEGLEDALAEKADAFSVNRKVSHEQFDAAYHELNRSIIDAQARLGCQEEAWISAIAEIQKDIGEKLDRMEIPPLQELIENKLRQLEDKVKAMSEKKKDSEACGTKKKLIRNINCISCDKKVAMKVELDAPLLPVLDGIAPSRSMRPFLTYELDHIKKELKSPNCCSNFGNVTGGPNSKADKLKSQTQGEGHYCSRYCGGSHTVITNEQRVRRVGHFPDTTFTDESIKSIHLTAEKPLKKS